MKNLKLLAEKYQSLTKRGKDAHSIRWNHHRANSPRRLQMIDRVAVAGMVGTGASFGLGAINELVGIFAGLATITFMGIKIAQEFRKK